MFDVERLFAALVAVLEEELEPQLNAYVNEYGDPSAFGTLQDRFSETIVSQVLRDGGLVTLVQFIGTFPSTRLVTELTGSPVALQSTGALCRSLATALGLPDLHVRGRRYQIDEATRLLAVLREGGDDGQVAGDARILGERLLREVALVAVRTPLVESVLDVVRRDTGLRLPPAYAVRETISANNLFDLIEDEDAGDLGFFAHLLVRTSNTAKSRSLPVAAAALDVDLVTQDEFAAWDSLAKALQAYVHFKPSQEANRSGLLLRALEGAHTAIRLMIARRVVPDAAIVLERVDGLFGSYYIGRDENGVTVRLKSECDLPLGRRIIYREVSNPSRRILGAVAPPWK